MKTIILIALLALSPALQAQTKTLYIVRHAKSSHDDPSLKDFDRPLADRGNKDATKVGKRLKAKGILPDLIMSSPSKRTKQTIKHICKEIGYEYAKIEWNQKIYRCSQQTYIDQVKATDDQFSSVMVVGHNPASTRCANYFQKDTVLDNVPTTGVVAIEFKTDSWKKISSDNATFKFFEYPKRKR